MSTEAQTQADLMKRVTRKVFDALNRGDVETLDETHSPDAVWHGPGGKEIRGITGIKEMVSGYHTAFPDMKMTIEHLVAEGDSVACHWKVVGTHDGPLGDIPATGKKVEIDGHILSRFERDKVVEEFEIFDELAMLEQIGVVET